MADKDKEVVHMTEGFGVDASVFTEVWFKLIWGIVMGVMSNVLADVYLRQAPHITTSNLSHANNTRRLRQTTCLLTNVGVSLLTGSFGFCVVFAAFSVTAATDFEQRWLPPNSFMFASVIASIGLGYLASGFWGMRDVLVTQAICFALATLSVALFGHMDSGDIKVAMQFGAACGSLINLYMGLLSMLGIGVLVLGIAFFTMRLRTHHSDQPRASLASLHVPVATWAWLGLLTFPALTVLGVRL
jgi:Flp pilus assembly protein protease CpaA